MISYKNYRVNLRIYFDLFMSVSSHNIFLPYTVFPFSTSMCPVDSDVLCKIYILFSIVL